MSNERNKHHPVPKDAHLKRLNCQQLLGKLSFAQINPPFHIHVHHRRHRPADYENLNAKAAIDALRYYGIIPDDDWKSCIAVTNSQEKIAQTEEETTSIRISEVADEETEVKNCTCPPSCHGYCKGECGCVVCHNNYQDFLSHE